MRLKFNPVQTYQSLFLLINWANEHHPIITKTLKLDKLLKVIKEKKEDYHIELIFLRAEFQKDVLSIEKRILHKIPIHARNKEQEKMPMDVFWCIESIFAEDITRHEELKNNVTFLKERFKLYTIEDLPEIAPEKNTPKEIPSHH